MTTTKYYLQITNGQYLGERTSELPGLPPGPSVPSENSIRLGFASGRIIASFGSMFAILHALTMFVADMFKSRCQLEVENLFLRHQLNIALRRDALGRTPRVEQPFQIFSFQGRQNSFGTSA
jgi:hypothetical protein